MTIYQFESKHSQTIKCGLIIHPLSLTHNVGRRLQKQIIAPVVESCFLKSFTGSAVRREGENAQPDGVTKLKGDKKQHIMFNQ